MGQITVVGGGIAGLTAAISAAEQGARGAAARGARRARRSGAEHRWRLQGEPRAPCAAVEQPVLELARRARAAPGRMPDHRCPASGSAGRTRSGGSPRSARPSRRCGCAAARPRSSCPSGRGRPISSALRRPRSWPAAAVCITYHHDPGELSAAFLWEPLVRGLLSAPPDGALSDWRLERDHRADARPGGGARCLDRDPVTGATSCRRRR